MATASFRQWVTIRHFSTIKILNIQAGLKRKERSRFLCAFSNAWCNLTPCAQGSLTRRDNVELSEYVPPSFRSFPSSRRTRRVFSNLCWQIQTLVHSESVPKYFGPTTPPRGNIVVKEMSPASNAMDVAVAISSGSEGELLHRFRQGDTDAFTSLYRDHSPGVFRFALHMTVDRGKAAEITQDVFVWLIRHPDKFDSERGNLAAFLAGVARQCIRRQQRTERRWLPFKNAARVEASTTMDPNDSIDAETLRKAVSLLPLRYREAIVLCDLEGQTYEQTAKLLNCAVGTIHSRLHRAHQLLARKFHRRKIQ